MRATWILALVLPLVLATGCFVFDELDAGMDIMEAHTPRDKKKKEGDAQATAKQEGEKPLTYSQATQAWWKDAKSLSTPPEDGEATGDPIVPCRRAGQSQFMKRSDCLSRGGEPG